MNEESYNEEFCITVNGPDVVQCDSVILEALNSFWKGLCHFYRVSDTSKIHQWGLDLQALNRLKKKPNRLPFMS